MRNEEDVLHITHDNPSTSTYHISSTTGQLSQTAPWQTVKLYDAQPVQGLQQGINSAYSFLDECYRRPCTPLNFCAVVRHEEKVYVTEVQVCKDVINHIMVTAADIIPGKLFCQELNLTSLWGMCSGRGRTL
jgi:hypothetical protein